MSLRERIAALRAASEGDPRWAELLSIVERLEAQNRRAAAEQARLEERLARVENSAIFRTLRAVGSAASDDERQTRPSALAVAFPPALCEAHRGRQAGSNGGVCGMGGSRAAIHHPRQCPGLSAVIQRLDARLSSPVANGLRRHCFGAGANL